MISLEQRLEEMSLLYSEMALNVQKPEYTDADDIICDLPANQLRCPSKDIPAIYNLPSWNPDKIYDLNLNIIYEPMANLNTANPARPVEPRPVRLPANVPLIPPHPRATEKSHTVKILAVLAGLLWIGYGLIIQYAPEEMRNTYNRASGQATQSMPPSRPIPKPNKPKSVPAPAYMGKIKICTGISGEMKMIKDPYVLMDKVLKLGVCLNDVPGLRPNETGYSEYVNLITSSSAAVKYLKDKAREKKEGLDNELKQIEKQINSIVSTRQLTMEETGSFQDKIRNIQNLLSQDRLIQEYGVRR